MNNISIYSIFIEGRVLQCFACLFGEIYGIAVFLLAATDVSGWNSNHSVIERKVATQVIIILHHSAALAG